MRHLTILFALWVLLNAAQGWAQSAECSLLSAMGQVDRAVLAHATAGSRAGDRAAISAALASIRAQAGVAAQSGVAGFDARFVADFAASREQAMALIARGAGGASALSDATLRATAARVAQLVLAFGCTTGGDDGERRAAGGTGETGGAGAAPVVRFDSRGRGRFTRLRDLGGNPWRLDGGPVTWQALSVFLLIFAAMVVLLSWLRGAHHRLSARFPCSLEVLVFRGRKPVRARLLDLSHLGARARVDRPLHRGERVVLKCRRLRAEARVVWANRHCAGLAFLRALDDETCAALLQAGRQDGVDPSDVKGGAMSGAPPDRGARGRGSETPVGAA